MLHINPLWRKLQLPKRTKRTCDCDIISSICKCGYFSGVGEPKAIPWTHVTPFKAAADAWCHMDIRKGDVVCWPTNLGWMMGPWLVYASLLNGASMALYNGSPLGSGFAKFVQVSLLFSISKLPKQSPFMLSI